MFSAHQQNYFIDVVSFAVSAVPVALLVLLVLLGRLEKFRFQRASAIGKLPIGTDAVSLRSPMSMTLQSPSPELATNARCPDESKMTENGPSPTGIGGSARIARRSIGVT